jgi:hypothetical protein
MEKNLSEYLKIGAIVVAISGSFYVMNANIQALMKVTDDHESRLRVIEKDFLMALGDIKAEFQSVKSRLTAIEKAIKQ